MNARKIPLGTGLWLVGVPIGTARDITLRALDVLASVDVLAAEDTRSLRKLMDIHGIPLEGRQLVSLHEHTGPKGLARLIETMKSGQSVAYASEAGMPLIADPGFELVTAVRAAGLPVTAAPGPSAVTTALALGGLGTDQFHFAGFLPNTKTARRKALNALKAVDATLVLYESPKRIAATLSDAADVLGQDRQACLCRELTKKFEEILQDSLGNLAQRLSDHPPKGEIVLLIDRGAKATVSVEEITQMLEQSLQTQSVKDAAKAVADATGIAKRETYQIALQIKRTLSERDTS